MDTALAEVNKGIKREIVNKCPSCGTPHSTGEFGKGTNIEVKCRRCKKMFHLHKPN